MTVAEPIRNKKHLKLLAEHYLKKEQYRNYALVILGVYTALRISDLLKLKWSDVYDEKQRTFREHITLVEKKTGKKKTIALPLKAVKGLSRCMEGRCGEYIFASNRKKKAPISRVQAWRIIHDAVEILNIRGRITCHSLRKTWGYHAWTGGLISPVLIMEAFNHSSYKVTRRYLGITQDDLDKAFLSMDFGI